MRIKATNWQHFEIEQIFLRAVVLVVLLLGPQSSSAQDLIVNEIMASNQATYADEDGHFEDWIEIKNRSGASLNLGGWHLSDDASNPNKWTFPPITLVSGAYLIVFASNKDRRDPASTLHTNFKLTSSGEFLGLFRPDEREEFSYDPYPLQFSDVSFGTSNDSGNLPGNYFDNPSPGAANPSGEANYKASRPVFSIQRGYYTTAFNLSINSADGLNIRYTTDGSPPSPTTGTLYSGAINISSTSNIRAIAFGPGYRDSDIETHTYVFVDDVIAQDSIDQAIVSAYLTEIQDSFDELPVLSISTGRATPDSLIGSTDRIASMEMMFPDASPAIQENIGVAEVGNSNFRLVKKSYRLFFKSEYGASKLEYPMFADFNVGAEMGIEPVETFDQLNLRGGSDDGFYVPSAADRGLYIRARWMNDTQFKMGQPSTHGRFVHLLINGDYFGQFHLHERGTAHHFANYYGGDKCDWDAHNKTAVTLGDCGTTATLENTVIAANTGSMATASAFINPRNLIDYVILNYHGGSPQNGGFDDFMAGRLRAENEQWIFHSWDADRVWYEANPNNIPWAKGNGSVRGVYESLLVDPEFRILVADRAYRHMFNGGALSETVTKTTWNDIEGKVSNSLRAEAARWGDGNSIPEWNAWKSFTFDFFDSRPNEVLTHMRNYTHPDHPNGIYPSINPPEFENAAASYNYFEGAVGSGFQLNINNSGNANLGTIYYTTDGTDPRAVGGAIRGSNGGDNVDVTASGTMMVSARVRYNGEWSALQTATFYAPQMLDKLVINEIHYHPSDEGTIGLPGYVDGDEFEFLEIKNTYSEALQLQGLRFMKGISYEFPSGSVIPAGGFVVLAENAIEFQNRYGMAPDGQYGDKLSNSGERLILTDFQGMVIDSLTYDDSIPWTSYADGDGPSLSLTPTAGRNNDGPASWNPSTADGGSPNEENNVNFSPDLSITFPNEGQRFNPGFAFTIQVAATDQNDSVDSVRVETGNYTIGLDESTPYNIGWTPPPGEYEIQAKGWDTFGAKGESETITISIATSSACSGIAGLVINEINYNDDDVNGPITGDWIEIYNPTPSAVDLSGWTFKDQFNHNWFVVPNGISIPAFGYHVIVQNHALFSEIHSITNKTGSFIWGLDGSGDQLRLYSNTGCLVDMVMYDDEAPWAIEADGQGATLELFNAASDNGVAANWNASGQAGGTPGVVNFGLDISIDLLTPGNNSGQESGSNVMVTARVVSGPPVSTVDVILDGIVVGQMTVDPNNETLYSYNLTGLSDGVFNIELRASNAAGQFDLSNASLLCIGLVGGGAFVETGGQVVFEAENYSNLINRDLDTWEERTVNAGYVGSYMTTEPDDGTKVTTGYAGTVSELQYLVEFETSGTYYLLYRGWADSGGNNSVHFGIDGSEVLTLQDTGLNNNYGLWSWSSTINDGTRSRVEITTPGIHVINLWLREDGTNVDRVVLTTDANFLPTAEGPEQSARQIQKVIMRSRTYLAGGFDTATSSMRTDLNSGGHLPISQPYAGVPSKSVDAGFFQNNPRIVDWVWLDFRTGTAVSTSVHKEAFLLRDDGWLMNPSGSIELGINGLTDGSYYVVVNHRNHLSAMTKNARLLEFENLKTVNFTTNPASIYQDNQTPVTNLDGTRYGLWQGDATGNGEVRYTSSLNDRVEILNISGGPTAFDFAEGYFSEDINLDGRVIYSGSNNDRVEVLESAGGPTAFDTREAQVPN